MNIPERLLVHSCTYTPKTGYDRDGNPTAGESVTLAHVRLEAVLAAAKSTEGESKDDKLTLFYDPTYSTPAIIPAELATIEWNGKAYTIRSVTPCYTCGGDSVHHYEAALV